MKRTLTAFVCALVIGASLIAFAAVGASNDDKEIRDVVELYFKGAATSEAHYFEKAFDVANAHMKYVTKDQSGKEMVRIVPITDAIKGWTSRPPEKSWGKILSLDLVDDKMAVAKVEMLYRGTIYVDLLSLYKINGEWKIVNKVFVSRGRVPDAQ
ncbi:MAG: nuclear transport factor 2 family protein [Blastocatellia bacterium]|nr:nuclear transport factor 2 family protein [Blastocatellia bacterium]